MTKTMSGLHCNDSSPAAPRRQVKGNGKPLSLTFVVPWSENGDWAFRYLPKGFRGTVIGGQETASPGIAYLREFAHLARRRPEWVGTDVIFAWELRTALAIALLQSRAVKVRSRLVVVGPILKNPIRRALPLIARILADADHIACFSRAERDAYPAMLKIPSSRFSFVPTPWRHDEKIADRDEGYILAIGDSARDYETLRRAVEGTDLPLRIIDRHNRVSGVEADELVARATFHVVPLRAGTDYSAGQSALLRAMAVGKAVIVSDTPGIRDYVEQNETAVLVPPGDAEALRKTMLSLWRNKSEQRRIGCKAATMVRKDFGFPQFAKRMAEIADQMI
jgi:glycosyltransferase involved in cell wall biosynthesis